MAGVRVMLKSGTMPFLIHTALKCISHVATPEHFDSAWIKPKSAIRPTMGGR